MGGERSHHCTTYFPLIGCPRPVSRGVRLRKVKNVEFNLIKKLPGPQFDARLLEVSVY